MIVSPICEMLGIRYPLFQGGMAWIADGKLAAAVSEGGGLGIVAAGIIFGALKTGAMYLNMMSQIPTEFVSVIQALVVIFVSAPLLIRSLLGAGRRSRKGGRSLA